MLNWRNRRRITRQPRRWNDGDADVAATASLAKACASDAYMQTAIHAIQIHGGIGFTWDNRHAYLWFKRTPKKSSEVLLLATPATTVNK